MMQYSMSGVVLGMMILMVKVNVLYPMPMAKQETIESSSQVVSQAVALEMISSDSMIAVESHTVILGMMN
jgi:hypothetical protein